MSISWISLFANVGIAEFYMSNLDIDIKVANELIPKRCDLYKFFYPKSEIICGDITNDDVYNKILQKSIENQCEFVIATPPCQWMSIAGKMNESDPRNNLIIQTVKFIKDLKPNYAIIENVPWFFNTYINYDSQKLKIWDFLNQELNNIYNLNMWILDAKDYETPQTRKRAITLICKKELWKREFPKTKLEITVRQAIWHLPSIESWEVSDIKYHFAKKHSPNHILRMKNTSTGKTALNNEIYYPQKQNWTKIKWFQTTYKRIDRDKPAPTITMCNGAISSQNNVHPWRLLSDWTYSDARVLSLKEIFILTWLPDDIEFPTWVTENFIRQVIWEWVPPKMIENIIQSMPNKK